MERVVLFIDYQNAFRGARDMFSEESNPSSHKGQFDPLALGELLASRSPNQRELLEVRIYRGLPSSSRDPRGYAAARAQIAHWQTDSRVTVVTRPLRYPKPEWPADLKPTEKGIDVQLAVDFATMAVREQYDTGILFSRDTDLLPALEFVYSKSVVARCETASWRNGNKPHGRLTIGKFQPFCHWVDAADFALIEDATNYVRS